LVPHLSGTLKASSLLLRASNPTILSQGPLILPELEPHVFEIMHNLRLISAAITSFRATPTSPLVDRKSISNAVYSVEHRLSSLRASSFANEGELRYSSSTIDLSQTLLLAAHLYIHLAIRELPGTAKMHLRMLQDLRASIPFDLSSLLFQASEAYLDILLWILFLGAAAAIEESTKHFFVQNLQHVCAVLAVDSKTDFENAIRGVLWLDGFCLNHCAAIWAEVGAISRIFEDLVGEEF
jgi:hypothetical protein